MLHLEAQRERLGASLDAPHAAAADRFAVVVLDHEEHAGGRRELLGARPRRSVPALLDRKARRALGEVRVEQGVRIGVGHVGRAETQHAISLRRRHGALRDIRPADAAW